MSEQKVRHLKKAIEELEKKGFVWDSMTLAIALPTILQKTNDIFQEEHN